VRPPVLRLHVRSATGWALASCGSSSPGASSQISKPEASPAEVREILQRARTRRDLAEAADRVREALRTGKAS
jgi:hypothetical protein